MRFSILLAKVNPAVETCSILILSAAMFSSALYAMKTVLRIYDSRWTPRRTKVQFRGRSFSFYSTYWWSDVSQELLKTEIAPYFETLNQDFSPSVILDVGAASGQFTILAAELFPDSTVFAFEPSHRQRTLLSRNARLNEVKNFKIEPLGLWKCADQIPFRTNGAESSFEPVSRFHGILTFPEKVRVVSLDQWVQEKFLQTVDLVKIDAEGAEIEILQGAQQTLDDFHPRVLVQAYHVREGERTFERCAEILKRHRYTVREHGAPSGLLVAT